MLNVCKLSMLRDERVLFEDLSFDIKAEELVQIEGSNGAGKTTLLRILAGLTVADEGEVFWQSNNILHCREQYNADLLFLGHSMGVKRELTAFENLSFYQRMHGGENQENIFQALIYAGLAGKEDIPALQLSAGQARRVALARLWISKAKLWILDEPLTAIDKQGVCVLEALFKKHTQNGGMVIFTTHQNMLTHDTKVRRIKLGKSDG